MGQGWEILENRVCTGGGGSGGKEGRGCMQKKSVWKVASYNIHYSCWNRCLEKCGCVTCQIRLVPISCSVRPLSTLKCWMNVPCWLTHGLIPVLHRKIPGHKSSCHQNSQAGDDDSRQVPRGGSDHEEVPARQAGEAVRRLHQGGAHLHHHRADEQRKSSGLSTARGRPASQDT